MIKSICTPENLLLIIYNELTTTLFYAMYIAVLSAWSYRQRVIKSVLIVIGLLSLSTALVAQTITTVAGSDLVGDGGPATSANILPTGVAVDATGNLFIADAAHYRIRKIAPNGTITTIAGNGTAGFSGDGGLATQASLSDPAAVAIDAGGNLYIVDRSNGRIRKVSTDGIITTVAGGGAYIVGSGGFAPFGGSPIGDGGPATEAYLAGPAGIAVDGNGNLYIADTGNNLIRKVDTNGMITTVAGRYNNPSMGGYDGDGGQAVGAALNGPSSVVVDATGQLFIADASNGRIRKVDEFGNISTIAGGNFSGYVGDGGPATDASINPYSMVLDNSGNLYFTDSGNRIRKIDNTGTIITVAGNGTSGFSGDGGLAIDALLNSPGGIAMDNGGNLVFADQYSYRVRKISTAGIISTVAGNGYTSFNGDGGPATSANLGGPRGVAVDPSGIIYISDSQNQRIRKVATSGVITTIAGDGTSGFSGDGGPASAAGLSFPAGWAVAANGSIYFVDAGNNRIRKIAPDGTISTVAGNGTAGFSGDGGIATAANLNIPEGIAIDGAGNLFIVDAGNQRLRKVTAGGIISTVAGNGTAGFSGDGGPATSAKFRGLSGVAIDGTGNIYLLDRGNYRVRKIATSGTISTVAGNGTSYYLMLRRDKVKLLLHRF